MAELGIAERCEGDAKAGETLVGGGVEFGQEVADHGGRNDVGGLVAGIVAHDHADEAAVADHWQGEAAVSLLEGGSEFKEEECSRLGGIACNADGGDAAEGLGDLSIRLELEDGGLLADLERPVQGEGLHALEEGGICGAEDGEVAVVIDALHGGGGFLGGGRFFQFDECRVRHEFGCYQNAVPVDQRADAPSAEGWLFDPWLEKFVDLIGGIDAQQGLGCRVRCGVFCASGRDGKCQQEGQAEGS